MKCIKNYSCVCLIIILGFFSACSVSKEARTMKQTINGNWILQTINAEGINGPFNAKIFNEASSNCFIGSAWNFISSNSLGTYVLSGTAAGCAAATRNIRWSIYEPKGEEKKLQFKRLDDKKNPMDDNNGFRLGVASLTDNSMQLKSAITFEGKPVNIVYNFIKK